LETPAPQNIVGDIAKRLRKKQGLTQHALAARCGIQGWDISENTITKIENGIRCLTDRELILLARGLGVKLHELLGDYRDLF